MRLCGVNIRIPGPIYVTCKSVRKIYYFTVNRDHLKSKETTVVPADVLHYNLNNIS